MNAIAARLQSLLAAVAVAVVVAVATEVVAVAVAMEEVEAAEVAARATGLARKFECVFCSPSHICTTYLFACMCCKLS